MEKRLRSRSPSSTNPTLKIVFVRRRVVRLKNEHRTVILWWQLSMMLLRLFFLLLLQHRRRRRRSIDHSHRISWSSSHAVTGHLTCFFGPSVDPLLTKFFHFFSIETLIKIRRWQLILFILVTGEWRDSWFDRSMMFSIDRRFSSKWKEYQRQKTGDRRVMCYFSSRD